MAIPFASSSPQIATFFSSSASSFSSDSHSHFSLTLRTTITTPSKKIILFHKHNTFTLTPILLPPPAAAAQDAIDTADKLYKTTDQGVATVVSALFFIAFIGLSAITIGVVYLVVTDFLQKREKEKFEKEEAAKGKRKKKKKVGRARAGPRGFGQKLLEDENDD